MGILDKLTKKKLSKQPEKAGVIPAAKEVKPAVKKAVAASSTKKATPAPKVTVGGNAYRIIKHPVISEKAVFGEKNGQYTFIVVDSANKIEIKNAIKQIYGVMPKKVRVMHIEGKSKRFDRLRGRRSDYKKAIVFLSKGQRINIHEGV